MKYKKMVDSRAKGARGEYLVRDLLREYTGHQFERVPASGALAYLKGDLWIPDAANRFCIEVKNYKDSPLSDKVFTCEKTNNLIRWWRKIQQQAKGESKEPLLFFKYNRSQVFVVTALRPKKVEKFMTIHWLGCNVMLAKEWLEIEQEPFINGI